jgi:hypothetical protein
MSVWDWVREYDAEHFPKAEEFKRKFLNFGRQHGRDFALECYTEGTSLLQEEVNELLLEWRASSGNASSIYRRRIKTIYCDKVAELLGPLGAVRSFDDGFREVRIRTGSRGSDCEPLSDPEQA